MAGEVEADGQSCRDVQQFIQPVNCRLQRSSTTAKLAPAGLRSGIFALEAFSLSQPPPTHTQAPV